MNAPSLHTSEPASDETAEAPYYLAELARVATAPYATREEWIRAANRIAELINFASKDAAAAKVDGEVLQRCRQIDLQFRKRRHAAILQLQDRAETMRRRRHEILAGLEALLTDDRNALAIRRDMARLEREFQELAEDGASDRFTTVKFDAAKRRLVARLTQAPPVPDAVDRARMVAHLEDLVEAEDEDALSQAEMLAREIADQSFEDLAEAANLRSDLTRIMDRLWTRHSPEQRAEWTRRADLKRSVILALNEASRSNNVLATVGRMTRCCELWPEIGSAGPEDDRLSRLFEIARSRYGEARLLAESDCDIPPLPGLSAGSTRPMSARELARLMAPPKRRRNAMAEALAWVRGTVSDIRKARRPGKSARRPPQQ